MEEMQTQRSSSTESQTAPWLVFFCGKSDRKARVLYSIPEQRLLHFRRIRIDEMERFGCWATTQDWLFLLDPLSLRSFLWHPVTLRKIRLPRMELNLPKQCKCVLSEQPSNPNCLVLLMNSEDSIIWYCRPGEIEWAKHRYVTPQVKLHSIAVMNSKIYHYDFGDDKLVIFELAPSLTVTTLSVKPWEYPPGFDMTENYLLESRGELFLVFFWHLRLSFRTIAHICVWKMDFSKQAWFPVENLGNRVFFVNRMSGFCASHSASDLGVKRNCIYFVNSDDKYLHIFDMEEGTIATHDPCPNLNISWCEPFFMMPISG